MASTKHFLQHIPKRARGDRRWKPADRQAIVAGLELPAKFEVDQVVISDGAMNSVHQGDVIVSLRRHEMGDWGEVDEPSRKANDAALAKRGCIASAYRDTHGVKFWIVTRLDRSITRVVMPDENQASLGNAPSHS